MYPIIHNMVQGTPEWDVVRMGLITGSRLTAVISGGKARPEYMEEIVDEIKYGIRKEHCVTTAMNEGTAREPLARYRYSKLFGVAVQEIGFYQMSDRVGISPDGMVGDDGLVEIKCPQEKSFQNYLDNAKKLVSTYKWQVQGQLWVTDRKWCDMFAWRPERAKDFVRIRAERNEKDIKVLSAGVAQFIKELNVKLNEDW